MGTRLAGKTAFLTAAAQGIGRATALAFAREGAQGDRHRHRRGRPGRAGARLRLHDAPARRARRRGHRGRGARGGPGAGAVQRRRRACTPGSVLEFTDADWDLAFNLNARAMAHTIRAFLPGMLAQGGGSIVNIASVAGSVKGVPNRFVYGASKAAVIGLTKAVAADFVSRGIRCNAICPGTVDSPSLRRTHQRAVARQRQIGSRGARHVRRPPADGPPGHAPTRSPRWRSTWPATRRRSPPAV